ncbi:outer membrane lipoprotein-sorting protein [Teredinibacter waterburyi]|jgi:Protein of unknown function (DUF1329).|uniref:outer membrane lipoprotein-sorting protein n=1 Tax=Teredinibacter waterburyi TaxID=1500538 RepID=UPI00165FE2E2|nr:outer membrane lipoprotein-sorting protein [Teredinibacter waterburyi]
MLKRYKFCSLERLATLCVILVNILCLPTLSADEGQTLNAADIMLKVDQRYSGDTSQATSVLVLVDKRQRQRVRDLEMYRVETKEVEKALIVFRSPADVEGTSYLSYEWSDPAIADDSWLYLPALQKVKRVASSEESGAFMGSDFSYADINGTDYEDYRYKIEAVSELVDGVDCWVISSIPVSEDVIDKTGYISSKSWVRKDNFVVVKAIIDVKKGKQTKYFSATDIEKIDGVWTAKTLQMVTVRRGEKQHSSVFKINEIVYNKPLPANFFDAQAMQRGL